MLLLPAEIWLDIFEMLDITDIPFVAGVCYHFYELTKHAQIKNKTITFDDYLDNREKLRLQVFLFSTSVSRMLSAKDHFTLPRHWVWLFAREASIRGHTEVLSYILANKGGSLNPGHRRLLKKYAHERGNIEILDLLS
jgi:hypothetical protein